MPVVWCTSCSCGEQSRRPCFDLDLPADMTEFTDRRRLTPLAPTGDTTSVTSTAPIVHYDGTQAQTLDSSAFPGVLNRKSDWGRHDNTLLCTIVCHRLCNCYMINIWTWLFHCYMTNVLHAFALCTQQWKSYHACLLDVFWLIVFGISR